MKHEGSLKASLAMKVSAEVPPTLTDLECCQVLNLVMIPGFIKYKNKTKYESYTIVCLNLSIIPFFVVHK